MNQVLPNDLIPLPTQPWDQRPPGVPLAVEEVRTALWRCSGNISSAADLLRVTSLRLRTFVRNSAYLTREMGEAKDQLVDKAEDVVREALDSDDTSRKDTMARYVLTNLGKNRGYGTTPSKVNINSEGGTFIIAWENGSQFGGRNFEGADVIDGECTVQE